MLLKLQWPLLFRGGSRNHELLSVDAVVPFTPMTVVVVVIVVAEAVAAVVVQVKE